MKFKFIFLALFFIAVNASAQFGVSFHQSNLPFVGVSYEINDRFVPEVRVGTDNYFEDISFEAVLMYQIINHEDYEFYTGLGVRTNGFTGVVIPVGVNIYPFDIKQFGFHIELTPIIGEEGLLRGSWGIRYKFKKK